MKRLQTRFKYLIAIGLVFSLAGILLAAQTAPHKNLVVNGKTVDGAIIEMDGRSYVDVEALGKAMGGVVTIEASRVVLNTSSAAAEPDAGAAPAVAAAPTVVAPALLPDQMSRDFMRSAVAELAEMREWRGAVGAVVTFGIPVTGSWPQDYLDRVQSGLEQVSVAAGNGADRDALELLQNEFATLQGWANDVISSRQALNAARSVDPNALQNDTVLAKITNCGQFLNSMIVSGTYADNSSCH